MTGTQGTRSAHFVSYRHHFRTILVSSLGSPHVPSPLPSAPEAVRLEGGHRSVAQVEARKGPNDRRSE